MKEDSFLWLQKWHCYNCYADVIDHDFQIMIGTIDNPGWGITIDLNKTAMQSRKFVDINFQDNDENDWFCCFVKKGKFEGVSGPRHFSSALEIFKNWVEKFETREYSIFYTGINNAESFTWLKNWYFSQCDGDWEHDFRVRIATMGTAEWHKKTNISELIKQFEYWPMIQKKSI